MFVSAAASLAAAAAFLFASALLLSIAFCVSLFNFSWAAVNSFVSAVIRLYSNCFAPKSWVSPRFVLFVTILFISSNISDIRFLAASSWSVGILSPTDIAFAISILPSILIRSSIIAVYLRRLRSASACTAMNLFASPIFWAKSLPSSPAASVALGCALTFLYRVLISSYKSRSGLTSNLPLPLCIAPVRRDIAPSISIEAFMTFVAAA